MKRLLICTIVRNQRPRLDRWLSQIVRLAALVADEYTVELSVAENDSTDSSAEWLQNSLSRGGVGLDSWLSTETLGTQQYGSVWSEQRLRQLANARQKCLDQVEGGLDRFDKVAYIEPDVTYNPEWCAELILARHPRAAGLGEPDIYSGWSLRSEANPKESVFLYDTCATRATMYDTGWDIGEAHGTWRAKTVIPTDLGGPDAMCLHEVWSTFNCFCVYNAEPFKQGLRWSYLNHRLDTGQGRFAPPAPDNPYATPEEEWRPDPNGNAFLDADTAVMCESFRSHGFNKVYLNTNCIIRHA